MKTTPIPVIAILDVGKTNKKIFLFDESYKIVYEHSDQFPETSDEDGDRCENIELLTQWCETSLLKLRALKEYDIRAINFSAYGASFVHTDEDGKPVLPLYNYLKPYPAALKEKFFNDYGGEHKVSMTTASPVLDSLNSGLQLYRLKHENKYPQGKIYSLHLPQYLSFLTTKKPVSDLTSIGCHTMLWDFNRNAYHEWVVKEGINEYLAPVYSSEQTVPVGGKNIPLAGTGLHDSSAALIPYLLCFQQPFVLISTGTWCISLNPFNEEPLTADELGRDCLCFLTYRGGVVKASRLFAGNEHEQQTRRLAVHFKCDPQNYGGVEFNPETVKYLSQTFVQDDRKDFHPGNSIFGQRPLDDFRSYEEAYHQLIMDIMHLQKGSVSLIMGDASVKRLFVDGGFGKNSIFMNLLALSFPRLEVFAASVAQATALGAALSIHADWNEKPIPADLIALKYYSPGRNEEKIY